MRKIIALISVVLMAASLQTQVGRKVWNFDTDKTGSIARGFTNEVGNWKVVVDTTTSSKPIVLAQLAKSSQPTFNVALVSEPRYKHLDVSVRMKAIAGRIDRGGGLVWRAKDAKNYYVVRYNPLEDNYRVYKVENGERTQLQSANFKASEAWHTIRLSMTADRIECYFDGAKYLDVKDSAFREAGKIGLWTKSDAQTHFDDLIAMEKEK